MATLIDHAFFARLNALNDKFAASIPDTLGRLDAARSQFNPHAPDAALIKELHQILHTVAGSAATFGFHGLGQHARQLEQRLRVLMAFDAIPAHEWETWLSALQVYIAWALIDPKGDNQIGDMA